MLHFLTLFLAPPTAQPQATSNSPPAAPGAQGRPPASGTAAWKRALGVLGNAAGFVALLAGCWLALQVLVALLQT